MDNELTMPNTREKLIELVTAALCNQSAEEVADHLIANGVTVQKWIPVTERLPEHFGQFSVTVTEVDGCRYVDFAMFDPYTKQWKTSLCIFYGEKVTHWMPLPEPPKGE